MHPPASSQPDMNRSFAEPDAARLSALVDAGPEAIAILDGQWRYVYVNLQFERLMGSGSESVLGRELWSMSPHLADTAFGRELRELMRDRRTTRMQYNSANGLCLDVHAMPFG